jgi:hypothetical protein
VIVVWERKVRRDQLLRFEVHFGIVRRAMGQFGIAELGLVIVPEN